MNKDKIICLIGASGSGKTTIAKELEKLDYNVIHSYTTREPREKNEWGHTFIKEFRENYPDVTFIEDETVKYIYQGKVIAYFEGYDAIYFATKDQYQGKGTSIYIVDNKGAEQVKQNVNDAEVVTVYLQADMTSRFPRLVRRGESNDDIVSRIEEDDELFKTVKCDYVVDSNRSVEEVLEDLLEVIN